ncbi:MAG: aminopeptidase [Nitrospinae bacterium]|nr:aminopeptidase [Nitrospinota bacterium]
MSETDLAKAAHNVIRNSLRVRKGEQVVVVIEEDRIEIAKALIVPVMEQGAQITFLPIFNEWRDFHRQLEKPLELTISSQNTLKSADVIISIIEANVGEVGFRKNILQYAQSQPCRIAHMPGVTVEDFRDYLKFDFTTIWKKGELLKSLLVKHVGKVMHIKTDFGTDIKLKISDKIHISSGIIDSPHRFGNLPAGEVYFVPEKNSANGHVVIDLARPGRVLEGEDTVEFDVKDGLIEPISGQPYNAWPEFKEVLSRRGANVLAEVGIGLNEDIKSPTGRDLIDEKMAKTMHFGIGDNVIFGGWNESEVHLDLVFSKPTVRIDNEVIMSEGKIEGI